VKEMTEKESFRKFSAISAVMLLMITGLSSVVTVDAGQNLCFPEWSEDSPVLIDKDIGRVEFAPWDNFTVEASYRYTTSCRNYATAIITWQALRNNVATNDITFGDPHAKKTIATIASGAQTGNTITIRATLSFANNPNGLTSPREVNIFVVSKPPAPKISLSFGPLLSLERFNVGIEGSEVFGSSDNFIVNCEFTLVDEQGKVVDTDTTKTTFGKVMPEAKLQAKNPGIHKIIAICNDSHGTVGTVTESVPIGLGTSKRSMPYLIVNKTLNCYLGNCVVDFSGTNSFGKGLDVEYYDITAGDNRNVPANPCGDQVCKLNITKQGVYTIKLVARFILGSDSNGFIYSDKGEAIVQVFASQNISGTAVSKAATPVATAQPTAAYRQPTAPIVREVQASTTAIGSVDCTGPRCGGKSAPGVGILATIFALVVLVRRIKK